MVVLGVIPARGGSKGVPGKNIRPVGGKPLLDYTIVAAQAAQRLTEVIVSTDDEQIAAVARSAGGTVPFLRPADLARDDTPDQPVLHHAVGWFEQTQGRLPDAVALLRPTTPLKTGPLIDAAIDLLEHTGADSVRTMSRAEGPHHPYWMYAMDDEGRARPWHDGIDVPGKYYQRQLLPPVYRLNGVVDVMRTGAIMSGGSLYGADMRILETPQLEALDIDTELDIQICEAILGQRGD
ncbi:MAG: acylneuraminate cytidylyltransferase family protein [Deltaproteobacteria bacterium]|nr:acylneuraminate cytidylyltransferase family protein [Deltaproteobacteria bacterium]